VTPAVVTPLTASGGAHLASSRAIEACMAALARALPGARVERLGHSRAGRPIDLLRLPALATQAPLRVALIGSQHGASEAAGGEALLQFALELDDELGRAWRREIEFALLPNPNPDGRDNDSSRNAAGINLNRDYVLLSQPETRAINRLLYQFAPDVLLDAHESACLKRRTLAREGYMTAFHTQFDFANHPAIPRAARDYCEHELLRAVIARLADAGVPVQRYIREIQSLDQTITHGGITIRALRNRAGLAGCLAFLLETHMEPKDGSYATFRNIGARVARQLEAVRAFVSIIAARGAAIAQVLGVAGASRDEVVLDGHYVNTHVGARIAIPLHHITSACVQQVEFPDFRAVADGTRLALPPCYWLTRSQDALADYLHAHGIESTRLAAACTLPAAIQHLRFDAVTGALVFEGETITTVDLPAGTLQVPARGRQARLLPLLFDARASSALCHVTEFAALWRRAASPFVYRALG